MKPKAQSSKKILKGFHVLITAGPSREYIDPVRFLSNPSSGRMGYALAIEAKKRGAHVTLVSGPVSLEKPKGVEVVDVISAADMYRETLRAAKMADIIIMAAAVADFRPYRLLKDKIKKGKGRGLTLRLKRTQDILGTLGKRKRKNQFLVGFAAETNRLKENARRKLGQKNLDMIVANQVRKGIAFGSETNEVLVLFRDGQKKPLPRMSKERLAIKLIEMISNSVSGWVLSADVPSSLRQKGRSQRHAGRHPPRVIPPKPSNAAQRT